MNRIAIANIFGVTSLATGEMAAVTGGLVLTQHFPGPKTICRFLPKLPICRLRPFPSLPILR